MHIPDDIYAQIVRLMPIPCVDLLVEDSAGRILMIKRANDPAKGQWWFPGGRVHYLETREEAARQKLKEECGIEAETIREIGTYDVILEVPDRRCLSHGITTLFSVYIENAPPLFWIFKTWKLNGEPQKPGCKKRYTFLLSVILRRTIEEMTNNV